MENITIDQILAFENGELDEQETVNFFQGLVDTGLAWKLQSFYGRTAQDMIEQGYVDDPNHPDFFKGTNTDDDYTIVSLEHYGEAVTHLNVPFNVEDYYNGPNGWPVNPNDVYQYLKDTYDH